MAGWSHTKRVKVEKAFYVYLDDCYVDSRDYGRISLGKHLYSGQRRCITAIFDALEADKHKIFVLKSRQLGISTLIRALIVFLQGVKAGLKAAIVFDTDNNKNQSRVELEHMIEALPKHLGFPKIKTNNRAGLTLENASQVLFMSAGVKKSKTSGTLGRSVGLAMAHCSELCSWDNDDGLEAFQQSLSDVNPDRLYIYESTARGYEGCWYQLWKDARDDPQHCVCLFLGWFSKDSQRIERDDPDYALYGEFPPNEDEIKKIKEVRDRYGVEITAEQLAWVRRCYDPAARREGDADPKFEASTTRIQEQPWCVVADTRVGTDIGIVPITEARFAERCSRGAIRAGGNTGQAHIWRVRTKLGYGFRGTANHPLITTSNEQIDLSESLGVRVRLQPPMLRTGSALYSLNWSEPPAVYKIDITPDLARFVGFFMGDGSASNDRKYSTTEVSICCDVKDMDVVVECERLFASVFAVKATRNARQGWITVRSGIKNVHTYVERLGLLRNDTGPTKRKVHVPEFIWRSPKYVVREFLSGLFEADGYNAYDTNRVALFSKYPEFIKDVQLLLLAFGITSRSVSMKKKAGDGHFYTGNQLELRTAEAIRFNEEIGFLSTRKRSRYDPVAYEKRRRSGPKRPVIVFEDEVVDVVDEGTVDDVWNLTVDEEHLFDANGILTHNTEDEAFQMTGSIFFTNEKLAEITETHVSDKFQTYMFCAGQAFQDMIVVKAGNAKSIDLKVWEEPEQDADYVLGIDPAYGHDENNDRSSIQICRCYADGLTQVAEYATPLATTDKLAWVVASLLGWYGSGNNRVRYALELNGPGEAVFNELKNLRHQIDAGYQSVDIESKGLKDVFRNVRTYIYSRADAMTAGHAWHLKCLAIDTELPTVIGWIKLKDVSVGERLFDDRGHLCTVLKTSDIKFGQPCYKITFDDKTSIVADSEHLWEVVGRRAAWDKGPRLVTTEKIDPKKDCVRTTEPLVLPEADLPIHPYILGVWLGDGSSASSYFFAHEDDVLEMCRNIEQCGMKVRSVVYSDKVPRCGVEGLFTLLRTSKLMNNKHIPFEYLRGSYEQRLALLQGLMDTDGTINPANGYQAVFCTTNAVLAAGFSELVRSFGMKVKYQVIHPKLMYKGKQVQCASAYYFNFTAYEDFPIFRLSRKLAKQKRQTIVRSNRTPLVDKSKTCRMRVTRRHRIVSVEAIESVPVRCIEVDSPSRLFLAGRGMIPTHNTNVQTKVTYMERLRDFVTNGSFYIRSAELISEMRTIEREGDAIKASGHLKDDRVMAAAFAVHCWETGPRRNLVQNKRTRDAEAARRRTSILDQVNLFNSNKLQDFFAEKKHARLTQQRMMVRQTWRYR